MNVSLSTISLILFSHLKRKVFGVFLLILFLVVQSTSLFAQKASLISCPADVVQNNDPGACNAIVKYPGVTSGDPNLTVVYSRPSGNTFAVGITTVVVQLLDQNGSPVSSCSFSVTVLDKEAPILSNCTGNLTVNNTRDLCGAVVSFSKPQVFERCTFQQKIFNYTGAPITFVVPPGVTSISADVKGAAGGRTYYNRSAYSFGGLGGETQTDISVTPGQVLTLNIGGAGQDGSATGAGSGGFNGGGNGTASVDQNNLIDFAGGGGGGASDIRTGTGFLADRIVVAGGGGGAGFTNAGGDGGDLAGQTGTGGTTAAKGGTQTQGGTGASYGGDFYGQDGSTGTGGSGAANVPGGGGGGGFFGGGGGSFGSGAGGSSYAFSNATNVFHLQGAQEGNGSVTFSYNQPATLVQTTGLPSGSTFPVGETINTFAATDAAGNTSTCTFKITVTDTQKPVLTMPASQTFNTTASTYSIPVLVATDNCGIASVTYNVTGATVRSGSGIDASGTFNPGASVIKFTVTDINGNTETGSTSVNVAAVASLIVSVADVYTVSPGGMPNTIYIGYGPSFVTLTANANGGKSPYTYDWTLNGNKTVKSTSQTLNVYFPGEYVVTVKDANGAIGTFKKQVQVVDVRCGSKDDKVIICRGSNGNSNRYNEICVSPNVVNSQLENGGLLGACVQNIPGAKLSVTETTTEAKSLEIIDDTKNKLTVYPNPASDQFKVQLNSFKAGKAEVVLLSLTGLIMQKKSVQLTGTYQTILFTTRNLATGIYTVKVVSDEGVQTVKVLVEQ